MQIAIIVLFLFIASQSLRYQHLDPNFTSLKEAVEEGMRRRYYPGAVIMLSNLTHTLFEEGFGYYTFKKDIHEIEVTTNTKYEIASITKIMATGLAVMNVINEGKLAY